MQLKIKMVLSRFGRSLSLQYELQRQGVDYLLVELSPQRSYFCKALGVAPRTLELFEALGASLAGKMCSKSELHRKRGRSAGIIQLETRLARTSLSHLFGSFALGFRSRRMGCHRVFVSSASIFWVDGG
jgi:2-polyprenyl-6-methoxyphenol hydroxylase-like FAD-dependent oxidoreductase